MRTPPPNHRSPIRSEACGTLPENPADDEPVTLGGRDAACYDLGPAVLTVRRAQAQIETQPDGVAVFLKLSSADTPVLGRILSENLYKQVALVIFGRVQTAPTVQDAETDGSIAIAGLDSQTAENVVKALSG
jgi:preprotein translocase subunit SecD